MKKKFMMIITAFVAVIFASCESTGSGQRSNVEQSGCGNTAVVDQRQYKTVVQAAPRTRSAPLHPPQVRFNTSRTGYQGSSCGTSNRGGTNRYGSGAYGTYSTPTQGWEAWTRQYTPSRSRSVPTPGCSPSRPCVSSGSRQQPSRGAMLPLHR